MHISFWPFMYLGMKFRKIKNNCIISSFQKHPSSFFTLSSMARTRTENSVLGTEILSHQTPFPRVQGLSHFCTFRLMQWERLKVPWPWDRNRFFPSGSAHKQQSRLSLLKTAERRNVYLQSGAGGGHKVHTECQGTFSYHLNLKWGYPQEAFFFSSYFD